MSTTENASLLSHAHGACPSTFNTTTGVAAKQPSSSINIEQEFDLQDAEVFELRLAEAQLATVQDEIDQMWKDPQFWSVHKIMHDTYSNPSDPRRHVPQRGAYGHRFVANMAKNNEKADQYKKQMKADEQLISALQKRNTNSLKRLTKNGKAPTSDAAKVELLVARGMEYCRTKWLDVDQQITEHNRVLDSLVADKSNWYMGTRFFVKGPWYFCPDDYRWQIDNADDHLMALCPIDTVYELKNPRKFYNHQSRQGDHGESYRGLRLKKEFERLNGEKKLLEVAVNKLSGY